MTHADGRPTQQEPLPPSGKVCSPRPRQSIPSVTARTSWGMMARMRASIQVVVVALLAACTQPTQSDPSPPVETTPKAPALVLPARALPVPEPVPWPIGLDDKEDRPSSPDVAVGHSRPIKLITHCGIDFRVDFGGSFWQSYGESKASLSFSFERGVMTLLSEDVAVFRFRSRGHGASIFFVRNPHPKPEVGCM